MQLSKSDYMLFLKHPAWLWLKKYDIKKLSSIDDGMQAIFEAGHKFEAYAEALFKNGVRLGFNNCDEYGNLTERTQQLLESDASTIFQSRFEWNEYNCLPDIIDVVGDKEIDLYEIKSCTKVKEEHLYDLAFQSRIIEANGLNIRKIYIIYVNKAYIRQGDINPEELSKIEDVTLAVHNLADFTKENMPKALEVIKSGLMPDPDPIYLNKLGNKREWQVIYDSIVGTPLPNYLDAKPEIIRKEIDEFLDQLDFPLYFLDYETMSAVVPYFDGHRPYQQIPSQYSIHILDTPESDLRHKEYLHIEKTEPSKEVARHLIEDIGDVGSIITWNMSFEKMCNKTLGDLNPEYAESMDRINQRIIDLMIPFKPKNGWYSDPRFEGSASIKKVLPVVVPNLSYKELVIQNGGSAQALWMQAVLDESRKDKEKILNDLLEYCKLDTLAMVEIYKALKSV